MKKIVYYLIILISLITYSFARYNFDKITQFENVLDISFLQNKPNEQFVKYILEQNKNIIDIIGISNSGFIDVTETQYYRVEKAKLVKIFGEPQKLFFKDDITYKPYFEKNGIYISDKLSYSIFKTKNSIGNKVFINNLEYVVCGVFEENIPMAIIKNDEEDIFDNIKVFFDKTQDINMQMNSFIRANNSEDMYVNNINTKVNITYFLLQIPKILVLLSTLYLFYKVFNFDHRFSVRNIFYQLIGVASIIILYFVLNIDIHILSNFTSNEWSDFDFYKNIFINFSNNIKNYTQIDKSLIFININKYIFIIISSLFICIASIIYCFRKLYKKRRR